MYLNKVHSEPIFFTYLPNSKLYVFRWLDSTVPSGMSNIDVVPLSGYTVVTDNLYESNELLRNHEVINNQLNTYWDEVIYWYDVISFHCNLV